MDDVFLFLLILVYLTFSYASNNNCKEERKFGGFLDFLVQESPLLLVWWTTGSLINVHIFCGNRREDTDVFWCFHFLLFFIKSLFSTTHFLLSPYPPNPWGSKAILPSKSFYPSGEGIQLPVWFHPLSRSSFSNQNSEHPDIRFIFCQEIVGLYLLEDDYICIPHLKCPLAALQRSPEVVLLVSQCLS